jgi:drug/metabolite transporter (DMT)-like permease
MIQNNDTHSNLYVEEALTPLLDENAPQQQDYECLSIRSESLPVQLAEEPKTSKLCGRILLILVAFLYGTLNVTLRLVYALPNPPSASALSCTRGWLAALCFLPVLQFQKHHTVIQSTDSEPQRRPLLIVGLELAGWNFGAQGLLALGLLSVESARASFFTQTSVVMTPVISKLAGHSVKWNAWIACLIALLGLFVLSDTSQGIGHFGVGDVFCLAGALSWSMYIFRLSLCQGYDEIQLQAVKTFLLAVLYSLWFGAAAMQSNVPLWLGYTSIVAWLLLFYSALGPGTIADVIQQKGQTVVSAAEGNVILSMEPVFTALLGLALLGESLSWQEMVGGGLIIIAAVFATQ